MSYMMGGAPLGGYQPASAPAPQERYPQLNRILHSEDTFGRSIVFANGLDTLRVVFIFIAVIGFGYNLIAKLQSFGRSGLPWSSFFQNFFDMHDANGYIDAGLVTSIYAFIIAIPICIILFIAKKLTVNSSITKLYDQFNHNGFVADLVPTGLIIPVGNTKGQVFVLGAPNVTPEWVQGAVQHMVAAVTNDPKSREAKAYFKALSKVAMAGGLTAGVATEANKADPSIPSGIFVTSQVKNADTRPRVAVPVGNDFTKLRLYPLKKNVPIA